MNDFLRYPIRTIHTLPNTIYLTFDDGPDPEVTPTLLKLLHRLKIPATFFVIGVRAATHRELLAEIMATGHSIGNHSWDHRYHHYFGVRSTRTWVAHSEERLAEILEKPSVGFRSPAGIVTPPLVAALKSMRIPLIHWRRRCFDTRFPFGERRALRLAQHVASGDILLFHDGNNANSKMLPSGIETFALAARSRGLEFKAIAYGKKSH